MPISRFLGVLASCALSLLFSSGIAAPAGDKPLAWADLVNRPELWPPAVKVAQTIKFTQGPPLTAGTVVHVIGVGPKSAKFVMADGTTMDLEPADVDLVAAANAYRSSLSPEQQKLDVRTIAADTTLVPEVVTVFATLKGPLGTFAAGSEANVLAFDGAKVTFAKGDLYASIEPARTDLLRRARELRALPLDQRPKQAYMNSLSVEQKAVTMASLAEDPSLIPAKVVARMPFAYQDTRVPEGTELDVLKVKGNEVEVAGHGLDLFVKESDTDVLKRARELRGMPIEKRPSRIPAMLAGTTIDTSGKKIEVKPADYYLFYFASSTCPRCQAYTPKFLERYKSSFASNPSLAVVTLSNNGSAADSIAFAKEKGTPWPIVPGDDRKEALNAYHVTLQPGMVVVDRFGKILATNAPGYPSLDTVDAVLDQLDGILKGTAVVSSR
jgi:hypothetical protein